MTEITMEKNVAGLSSAGMVKLLNYVVANQGVVLRGWFDRPHTCKVRLVVFPTKLRKPIATGVSSEFVRQTINEFYPEMDLDLTGVHRATVLVGGKPIQLLESDLERRVTQIEGGDKVEHPGYAKARRSAETWTFLGVKNVLVEAAKPI